MPEFTEKEANRIIKRFSEVAPNPKCPLCHTEDFSLLTGIVALPLQEVYPNMLGLKTKSRILPCVSLICKNCGNTFLINLLILGGLDDLLKEDY